MPQCVLLVYSNLDAEAERRRLLVGTNAQGENAYYFSRCSGVGYSFMSRSNQIKMHLFRLAIFFTRNVNSLITS